MDALDLDTAPTSRIFHRTLMQALGKTLPHATADEWAEKWDAAREEFDSLGPRTPAEARLAAFAVASMQAAMDNFARAAQPGTSDEKAGRLRGSALAAGRFYKSVMLTLRKPRPEAAATPSNRPASFLPPPFDPAEDAPTPSPATPKNPGDATPPPAPFPRLNRAQRRAAASCMAKTLAAPAGLPTFAAEHPRHHAIAADHAPH